VALASAGALAACGSKPTTYPMRTPSNGDASTSFGGAGGGITPITGTGGHISATGSGGAAVADAGPPSGTVKIDIQSPMGGSILSGNAAADVAAKITITGGTDIIDPATVRVSIAGTGFMAAVSAAPLVGPTGADMSLFSGKLSLAGLPSGSYTLTVSASSSTGVMGSAMETLSLDAGPKITVISPIPGHHYKGSLIVQAIIDPGDFMPASNITCSIAGQAIMLQPAGPPNVYRAVFDLTMPSALSDDQVFDIAAQDNRKVTTEIKFVFNVDTRGPTITSTTPPPGAIVGQVIRLSASIADPAGLDLSSLQVLIGDKTNPQFKLPLMPDGTGAFSALFDTRQLTSCKLPPSTSLCIVRPTVSFRAADALGNETTVSYEIALDNLPPIADLVPPPVRSSRIAMGNIECSFAYSPLSRKEYSGDAPDDGCRVPQMFDLRARIEDTGNIAAGIKQVPIAGVDPNATAAYILADTSQPLVVDIDGDGNCDAINPKLVPTTMPLSGAPREVLKVRLKPVPPAGTADFRPDNSIPASLGCVPGTSQDPPLDICRVEQPLVAISYIDGKTPAIWAAEPIAPDDPRYCFGSQLDTNANNVPESSGSDGSGWRCIAIATADLNGNISTSAPIRVWVDYKYGGSFNFCNPPGDLPGPKPPGMMPSCTGTYDKVSDTVSAKACKARNFVPPPNEGQEVCFQNICD
jgi:hypothetical protein